MVDVGDYMVNRISGDTFLWRATCASTNGEYAEFEGSVAPYASVPARHRHPRQEERLEVLSMASSSLSATVARS